MTTTAIEEPTTGDYPKPSWFDDDPFTMGCKLCDDDGIVRSDPRHPNGYQCTGHAHRYGERVECLSSAHRTPPTTYPMATFSMVVQPNGDGYACLRIAADLRNMLAAAPKTDDDVSGLLRDADALERIGRWLTQAKPILLPATLHANTWISGDTFTSGA